MDAILINLSFLAAAVLPGVAIYTAKKIRDQENLLFPGIILTVCFFVLWCGLIIALAK